MKLSPLLAFLPAAALLAQDPARNPKLHVAFVGTAGSARTADFTKFLEQQFGSVQVVDRSKCEPKDLAAADVVLLDWNQQEDGVMTWVQEKGKARRCPLGERSAWTKPTVLLGSAGLNLAILWGTCGSYG
jgi:hypothetical protein